MSSGLIGTIRNEQANAQSDNVLRAIGEELFAPAPGPASKIDTLLDGVAAIRRRLDDVETRLSLIDARQRVQVTQQAILSKQVEDLQVSADSIDESIGAFERVLEGVAEGVTEQSQVDVIVLDFGGR